MRGERKEHEQFIINEVFFSPKELEGMLRTAISEGLGEGDEDLVPKEELPAPERGAVLAYLREYDEADTILHDEPVEVSFRWITRKPLDKPSDTPLG